jgi:outer membrane protein
VYCYGKYYSIIKKQLLLLLLLFAQTAAKAQQTLASYIELAKKNSYATQLAQKQNILAALTYQSFKLTTKPSISFYGNAPVYNKDNYAVTQPDGSIKFLPRSQNYSNAGFAFSQPIAATGGTVSVNTDLYRFDNFTAKTKQYNGTPVFLRLSQPLFKFNKYKWDKLTEPLKLQEAHQQLKTDMRQIEYDVCLLFFDIINAQTDGQLATANLRYAETNLAIEKRRLQLGASTEDKVLQLEMQQINSTQQQAAAQIAVRRASLTMQAFINSTDTATIHLQLPEQLPVLNINKEEAVAQAKQNLPEYISFQRKMAEAQSKTDEAKKNGRQIDLVASYGLNNAATDLAPIYQNPQNQQRFSIGFNIPIADWGKKKNGIAVAKVQEEQVGIENKQQETRLLTEIENLVNELPVLKSSIRQLLELDTLSHKRFTIANRLYQSGKVSLLELQAAQTEKDNARRNYIMALRKFWETCYLLNSKTNFSFF